MDVSIVAELRLGTAELPPRLLSFDRTGGNSNLALIALARDHVNSRRIPYPISNDVIRRPADRA